MENQSLRIGITGGIGSGKTTICKIFESLGIPVYYADVEAKRLMVSDQKLVQQIKNAFGEASFSAKGLLNRGHLSDIVFQDKHKLFLLNSLVHPTVEKDFKLWNMKHKDVPYTLKEAALIYESGSNKMLDRVIHVYAPLEIRIERVMKRDNVIREQVLERVRTQLPEEEKIARSDHVIINDNTLSIVQQVHILHNRLCSITKNNV